MAARAKTVGAKATARRSTRKAATVAPKKTVAAKKPTLAQVKKERDQLSAKLKQSEARVAELEAILEQTLNRIDWAIDSLQNAASGER